MFLSDAIFVMQFVGRNQMFWELLGIEFLGRVELFCTFLLLIEDGYALITFTEKKLTELIKTSTHSVRNLHIQLLDENKYTLCSYSCHTIYWTKASTLFVSNSVIYYSG